MKRFIGIFMGVAFLACFHVHVYAADNIIIGVVDMAKFQQRSTTFQKIKEDYVKKMEPMRQELEQEQSALVKLEEELRKQSMMLSLDAKEDRRKEMGKKSRRFEYLKKEFLQEVKQSEVEALRVVGEDLQRIVQEIGKKGGYTMILEKRAVGFLYNDDKIDITDEVIQAYDQITQ